MPSRLDNLLFRSHKLDRTTLEALEQTDYEELRAMTLGENDSPNRARAMEAFAKTSVSEAPEVLGRVLEDPSTGAYLRAAAATQIGRLDQPEAEVVLLNHLSTAAEPIVRMKMVQALARVGGARSIDELEKLAQEDPNPGVRALAGFSCSVIAYRNGLSGHELPVPAASEVLNLDPRYAVAIVFGRASVEETRATLASLGDDTYGLMLSNQVGYRIECGSLRMFLALEADLVQHGITTLASKGRMLLGLIAQRSSIDGSLSARLLPFAWTADENRFHMAVHRTDGKQLLFGSGTIDGNGVTFELNGVSGRGSKAVLLRGLLRDSDLSITEALSSRSIVEQSVPRKLE